MKRTRVSDWIFLGLWVLVALGIAGVYSLIHAEETLAAQLVEQLHAAERSLAAGDWAAVQQTVADARKVWERARAWLALHTEHDLLQEVSETLLEAEALARIREPQALRSLLLARDRIESFPQRDRLLLRNLF